MNNLTPQSTANATPGTTTNPTPATPLGLLMQERLPSDRLMMPASKLAYMAFEDMELPGFVVIDGLKNMQYTFTVDKNDAQRTVVHGEGVFFAEDEDGKSDTSVKMSFHLHAEALGQHLNFTGAYAYDTRSGNEVGFVGSVPAKAN